MQVVGVPVGSDIGTMSPDAPHGLSTDRLPDVLAILDVLTFEEDLSIRRHHLLGEGGHGTEDLYSEEAKYPKRHEDHCR